MIKDFPELTLAVNKTLREKRKMQSVLRKCIFSLDFSKVKELYVRQLSLNDRIHKMIKSYKEKLNTNYLENKIYEDKLESFEKSLTSESLMNDIIFCVVELNKEYLLLKEIEMDYLLNGRVLETEKIKTKLEIFMTRIEFILIEGKALCKTLDEEKLEGPFLKLLAYFCFNYNDKKEFLLLKLRDKQILLKSERVASDLKLVGAINKEIEETKIELESIELKLLLIA